MREETLESIHRSTKKNVGVYDLKKANKRNEQLHQWNVDNGNCADRMEPDEFRTYLRDRAEENVGTRELREANRRERVLREWKNERTRDE